MFEGEALLYPLREHAHYYKFIINIQNPGLSSFSTSNHMKSEKDSTKILNRVTGLTIDKLEDH